MKNFVRYPYKTGLEVAKQPPTIDFLCFKPDLEQESQLYNIDNEPINIIDNSSSNPVLQNVASQVLQDISSDGLNFDGLSDSEVLSNTPPRHLEFSEVQQLAKMNLKELDKQYKEYQSNNKSD